MLFVSSDVNIGTTFAFFQTVGKVLDSMEKLIMLVSVRMNDSDLFNVFIMFIYLLSKQIPLEFFNLLIILFMVCALIVGSFSMRDVNLFVMLNSGGGRVCSKIFCYGGNK